jgi:hypothetical protein
MEGFLERIARKREIKSLELYLSDGNPLSSARTAVAVVLSFARASVKVAIGDVF